MSKVLLAVPCGGAVRDQRVARHLQFLEGAVRRRRRLGRPQRQRCPHLREHPRVYGVGLGALSHRLRKTPRLQGIGSRQRQPRLQERLLEGAVPRSGGLVHDRANRLGVRLFFVVLHPAAPDPVVMKPGHDEAIAGRRGVRISRLEGPRCPRVSF